MERAGGVDGAFLRAADPQALARWYAEHLGVAARSRADGVELHGAPGRAWDVSVEVEDLDAVVAGLRAAGAELRDDGGAVLVHDPAGHVLRLHRPEEPQYVRPVAEVEEQPPRRVPARVLALVVVAVVAVVLAVVLRQPGEESAADDPPEKPAPELSAAPTTSRGPAPAVSRMELPISGDWELFVYQPGQLVRVELDRGRITRTPIAAFPSRAPVTLVAGPDSAVVQSEESAMGYLVADGRPATELGPQLARASPALPGPEPGLLWLPVIGPDGVELTPARFDGTQAGRPVLLPSGFWTHSSDGRGGLVVGGVGGQYLAGSDGVRRITTGQVLAVGPTRFLVLECDASAVCHTVLIDRAGGDRRRLQTAFQPDGFGRPGVISPDGRTAAVARSGFDGDRLIVLDLDSGRERPVPEAAAPTMEDAAPVWSPDGRWLLTVVDDDVVAVDPRSGRARSLELGLASVDAVAVRP